MKRLYLDVCSLCRPFDDQNYASIRLETEAVNIILSNIKEQQYELMVSPVQFAEINSISDDYERLELIKLLENYGKNIKVDTNKVKKRAEELISLKFGIADAAHIAFAEIFKSTFITCDDNLLKKCKKPIDSIECFNPIIFCEMENLK